MCEEFLVAAHGEFKMTKEEMIKHRPKTMTADSLQPDRPDKEETFLRVYEIIDDNQKRTCWSPFRLPRPTEFRSELESAHILQVWERIGR